MKVFKAFGKGLICRGYRFKKNKLNICESATCVQCGFHAAENPLDCLSYYPDFKNSEFYVCQAGGDIHEDGTDSKISCTELIIGERLTMERFVEEVLIYCLKHPTREHSRICKDTAKADGGFAIVKGIAPTASGKRGDVLGFIEADSKGRVYSMAIRIVSSAHEKWQLFRGELREVADEK